jgi:hypothetical protein
MGLMDKVKAQAEQAVAKGKQGVSQGQSKLDAMQAHKRGEALMRDLGAAYYAQQRSGGSADDVAKALAAVDAHVSENGAVAKSPPVPEQPEGDGTSYDLTDL